MGEVYLARSEGAAGFHRPVVVKRVLSQHATDAMIVGLFQREARIMSTLRHPNIVSVLDFGKDASDHVMVIEYVHGLHLGRWLAWLTRRAEAFPVERALQIMLDVLAALEHAHQAQASDGTPLGIVHRDISPANVLIDVEGTVKLADFGIASMEGEHTVVDADQPAVKGKFPYLPPEILLGDRATPLSDVYAAGVVLDELLRGRNAFRTGQATETLGRVLEHVPPLLDTVRADVSAELARVVARAIQKKVERRYATSAELAAALRAVRAASPDDARNELAAAARRDFHDPAMAEALGLPELDELETLWHGPVPTIDSVRPAGPSSRPPSIRPTVPARRGGAPARRPWLAISALVVVLGALAVGVTYALTRSPDLDTGGGPLFVVVDRTERGDGGPSGARDAGGRALSLGVAADAGDDRTGTGAGGPASSPVGEATAPSRPAARSVEAPFRARAAEISACFAAHVEEIEGSAEVVVHFSVRADGTVEAATIAPAEVGGTALGHCIVGVAESTRFASGGTPVSFRVPLGARRVGR